MQEEAALRFASELCNNLASGELKRKEQSLRVLQQEQRYVSESLRLQSTGFLLAIDHFPFQSQKSFAAEALGFSIFDHLRRGWLSLLEGYYLPSMTMARYVFEALLFEAAIGVALAEDYRNGAAGGTDSLDDWLSKWWRDQLGPGTVGKLISYVDRQSEKRGSRGESSWSKSQKALWKLLAGWAHANWVPIALSGNRINYDQRNPDIPALSFAGQLSNPDSTKLLGNLYAYFAVEGTFLLRLAFIPQLHTYVGWNERVDTLMADYDHWKDSPENPLGGLTAGCRRPAKSAGG